jgi:hypothetical protein
MDLIIRGDQPKPPAERLDPDLGAEALSATIDFIGRAQVALAVDRFGLDAVLDILIKEAGIDAVRSHLERKWRHRPRMGAWVPAFRAAIAILCERQGYKGRAAGRMISRLLVGDESRAESIRALLSAARKSHGDNPLTLHLADAWLEDLKGRHVQHWLRERLPAWQAQPQKIF